MSDIQIECRDCHTAFSFTDGEQQFFSSKGLTPPVRCKVCRSKRKPVAAPAAPKLVEFITYDDPPAAISRRNGGPKRKSRKWEHDLDED